MGINILIDDANKKRVDNENHKYDKVNFKYDLASNSYTCPEGEKLALKSTKNDISIYECNRCPFCPAKELCTKSKRRIITRDKNEIFVEENREKIMSEEGAKKYQKRMHTVEPVYGNIGGNRGQHPFFIIFNVSL